MIGEYIKSYQVQNSCRNCKHCVIWLEDHSCNYFKDEPKRLNKLQLGMTKYMEDQDRYIRWSDDRACHPSGMCENWESV
jgi:hypothetical protein